MRDVGPFALEANEDRIVPHFSRRGENFYAELRRWPSKMPRAPPRECRAFAEIVSERQQRRLRFITVKFVREVGEGNFSYAEFFSLAFEDELRVSDSNREIVSEPGRDCVSPKLARVRQSRVKHTVLCVTHFTLSERAQENFSEQVPPLFLARSLAEM